MSDIKTLRIGDRVRIVDLPAGWDEPGYTIYPETIRAYKKLIRRGTAVRISEIDEFGQPSFRFRFRRKNGRFEFHWMVIGREDKNWVRVKPRKASKEVERGI